MEFDSSSDWENSGNMYEWDSSDDESAKAGSDLDHVEVQIPDPVKTKSIDYFLPALEPWATVSSTQDSSDGSPSDGESVAGYEHAGDIIKLDDTIVDSTVDASNDKNSKNSTGSKKVDGEFQTSSGTGEGRKQSGNGQQENQIQQNSEHLNNGNNSQENAINQETEDLQGAPKKVTGEFQTPSDTGEDGKQSGNGQQENQVQQNPEQLSDNENKNLENANDQESVEPTESPSGQPDGSDYFNTIYKTASISITRIRLMLVGHFKAGKTCLVDSLLGKQFRDPSRTDGIDVTTCSVDVTSSENWNEVVYQDLQRFYEEVEALRSEILLPDLDNSAATSGYGSVQSQRVYESMQRIYESMHQKPEIKIWDMGGEFGYYCSHQMFLDSQCIYLLVMDASKDVEKMLDAEIPLSHATEKQKEKIHCPRTMRDFLDYWLDTISTFINPGNAKEEQPSIAIVLTHIDKLGPRADKIIAAYRQDIATHISSKYAVRFVYRHIFAVSNTNRSEETFDLLRTTVFNMAERKPQFSKEISVLEMIIEVEIRKYAENTRRKCFSLDEIKSMVVDEKELPFEECKAFLTFQHKMRRMVFIETPHESCNNGNGNGFTSIVITDPQYVTDVFRSVIRLWHSLSNDTSAMSLYQMLEIEENIEEATVSWKHLGMVWRELLEENITIAHLAWMLYRFKQILICNGGHSELLNTLTQCGEETKFTVPNLLPPLPSPSEEPYTSTEKFKFPLIYYFFLSESDQPGRLRKSNSFLPTGFLPILASMLSSCRIDGQPWQREKLYFDTTQFRTGKYHDLIVTLSVYRNVIFANIFPVKNAQFQCAAGCVVSFIRTQIEKCICATINERCPQLKCGVCISPCYTREITTHPSHHLRKEIQTDCLNILWPVQENSQEHMPLKTPVCQQHKCDFPIDSYSCWFCTEETNPNTNPDKILLRISEKVPNEFTLRKLFSELGIPSHKILQRLNDKHGEIGLTANYLLEDWLAKKVGGFSHGSGAWTELKDALERAGLPSPNQIMAEL